MVASFFLFNYKVFVSGSIYKDVSPRSFNRGS